MFHSPSSIKTCLQIGLLATSTFTTVIVIAWPFYEGYPNQLGAHTQARLKQSLLDSVVDSYATTS